MKLKEIEIEKYRTIENLILSMADLLILIGENNCGKSNILRALELFYQDSVKGIESADLGSGHAKCLKSWGKNLQE